MGVAVGIEDIDYRPFPHRHDHPIGGLPAGELVEPGLDVCYLAAEVNRLPDEEPGQLEIRGGGTDLVGFPAREARHAKRIGEPKALIDFWVDP